MPWSTRPGARWSSLLAGASSSVHDRVARARDRAALARDLFSLVPGCDINFCVTTWLG